MSVQVACPRANIRASNLSPCRRVVSWDCHESDNFIFAICEFGFSYLLQRFLQENERAGGTFLLGEISRGMVTVRVKRKWKRKSDKTRKREKTGYDSHIQCWPRVEKTFVREKNLETDVSHVINDIDIRCITDDFMNTLRNIKLATLMHRNACPRVGFIKRNKTQRGER